ncbi:MAG: ABC transporter substrate-binding protein [Exilispira sp.]|nr:ABC transporter substrate-binding protein [Exilispira sp.]
MYKKRGLSIKNVKKLQTLIALILLSGFCFTSILETTKANAANFDDMNLLIGYIPHVQFTPLYVGIEKGIFQKYGINLKIDYSFGRDIFGLLMAEKADFALTDSDELIISCEKGMGLKSFFQYYQDFPISMVALNQNVKPEDLYGKKIGLPDFYGTNYIGTLLFVNRYRLANKTEIVKIGYTQIQSLVSKKVDVVACYYNNEPIQLRLQGYKITEWKIKDFSNLVGGSFVSSEKNLKNKHDQFSRLIKALTESIEYTNSNRDEALDIAYRTIGSLQPQMREFWKEVLNATLQLIYGKDPVGSLNTERYRSTVSILFNLNFIKSEMNPSLFLEFIK